MTELTSFKNKSRLITMIAAIVTILSMISVEMWQDLLPGKYVVLAPVIVGAISFIASQVSEEQRVTRAEELVHQEYKTTETVTDSSEETIIENDVSETDDENVVEVGDDDI